MVKIQSGIATREPIPQFLIGLAPESLADLAWADPALGVSDLAWWPEENGDGPLPNGMKWGAETLTPDLARKVVVVTHASEPLNAEELEAIRRQHGMQVTVLAFLSRFTDAEAVAIDLASIGSTVPAASIRRYLSKVNAAKFIDLLREDTREGVQVLETMGLISAGRAAEILDTPVQPTERPQ